MNIVSFFLVFVKIPSLILKCLKVNKINQTKLNVIRIEKMSKFTYFFPWKYALKFKYTDNSMWIVKETSRSFDYINFKRWFNGGIFIELLEKLFGIEALTSAQMYLVHVDCDCSEKCTANVKNVFSKHCLLHTSNT